MAPGNTAASFEAALACRVDMIEFDVLPLSDGRLVLAHDYEDAAAREPLTLAEGLDHLAGEAYGDVELDVDLKLPGYEAEVVAGLLERGLDARSLISSTYPESLAASARWRPGSGADGRCRGRGATTPRACCGWPPRTPRSAGCGRACRPRPRARCDRGECEALMVHRLLVSRRLVGDVHAAGGLLYVWTVDDADEIERLERARRDGVITNDPRLFDSCDGSACPLVVGT